MAEIHYHSEAVDEIFDTIKSDSLWRNSNRENELKQLGHLLIHRLENVEKYQDPDWPNAGIIEPMNWNDIVGDADCVYYTVTDNHSHEELSAFTTKFDNVYKKHEGIIEKRTESYLGQEEGPELTTMIYNIGQFRAACGIVEDSLHEKFWKIIQLGGYPCGWEGDENGRMVVYVPRKRWNFWRR